jgi:hypothetical protein
MILKKGEKIMTALQETIETTPKYLHHVLLVDDEPSVAMDSR